MLLITNTINRITLTMLHIIGTFCFILNTSINSELSLSVYHGFRTQKPPGKVCAYTSPANFMPQLMRVSYIRRVRARLSCGV